MLVRTLVAPLLGAACHVVVDGSRCVVVDPGGGVVDDLVALVEAHGWRPVAVLLTHGHLDHTWSAGEVQTRWGVPVHVHADDAYRVHDPVGSLGPLGVQLVAMTGLSAPPAPADLRTFTAPTDEPVELPLGPADDPVLVRALHCPGHTQGSTTYLVPLGDGGTAALTGDVLFAGTIGRTDLPGGDDAAMARTLQRLATLDATTQVLPGHGPASTIGRETRDNPFLRPAL